MSEFLAMGGYGFFVWSAYGMTALALALEVLMLRSRRKAALVQTRLESLDAATDAAAAS